MATINENDFSFNPLSKLNLAELDGSNGFVINGAGSPVSNAGDVNGDGFDDLIVGAPSADPNGQYDAGESYVVLALQQQPLLLEGPSPLFATKPAKQAIPQTVELRPRRYLNNFVEQDHRFIKRFVKLGIGFGCFNTARRTLRGYETMHMIRKGQIQGVARGDVLERVRFICQIFGVAG